MDPVLIEDDGSLAPIEAVAKSPSLVPVDAVPTPELPLFTSVVPKQGPLPKVQPFSVDVITTISKHLKLLLDCLSGIVVSPSPNSSPPDSNPVAPKLFSSLSPNKVVRLVHRPGLSPPPVHPCDQSNGVDTKTHWTLEERH